MNRSRQLVHIECTSQSCRDSFIHSFVMRGGIIFKEESNAGTKQVNKWGRGGAGGREG